jgi:hypothetical protein
LNILMMFTYLKLGMLASSTGQKRPSEVLSFSVRRLFSITFHINI